MAILASNDLQQQNKLRPMGLDLMITPLSLASLACACKSDTLRSLYSHALLSVGKSAKYKKGSGA